MLDGVSVVMEWPFHQLLEAIGVGPTSLQFVGSVGHRNELIVMMFPVLLALPSPGVVTNHIHGLNKGLALVSAKVGPNDLLARGMAGCKVKQLPRRSRLVAFELMNEGYIGGM